MVQFEEGQIFSIRSNRCEVGMEYKIANQSIPELKNDSHIWVGIILCASSINLVSIYYWLEYHFWSWFFVFLYDNVLVSRRLFCSDFLGMKG